MRSSCGHRGRGLVADETSAARRIWEGRRTELANLLNSFMWDYLTENEKDYLIADL